MLLTKNIRDNVLKNKGMFYYYNQKIFYVRKEGGKSKRNTLVELPWMSIFSISTRLVIRTVLTVSHATEIVETKVRRR